MTRLLVVMVLGVVLTACGPSSNEFMGACLARCAHVEGCGYGIPDGHMWCSDYCESEWDLISGESADCAWFAVYWFDCETDTSCDGLLYEHCMGQLGDMAAACF